MFRATLLGLLACVLCAGACGTRDATPPDPFVERDSAGITIVENRIGAAPAAWTVSPDPTWAVGGADAPEEAQLYRVSGAVRLQDGRVALSNSGTGDVRVFDAAGRLQRIHGREGDGPGEFRAPILLGVLGGDSLVVWDRRPRRVSLVHADSGFARSYRLEWTGSGSPVPRGILDGGEVVMGGGLSFAGPDGVATGLIRPLSTFGWATEGGAEVHLVDLPSTEMFAEMGENRVFRARMIPFARSTRAAAARDGVWIGISDAYELRFYGRSAELERIARLDVAPEPVTAADVDAAAASRFGDEEPDPEALRQFMEMPTPELRPAHGAMLVDREGWLWVEDFQAPGADEGRWTVFDPQGRIAARLAAPPSTQLYEVGGDYLLGVTRDELDVESLTIWSLTR